MNRFVFPEPLQLTDDKRYCKPDKKPIRDKQEYLYGEKNDRRIVESSITENTVKRFILFKSFVIKKTD
jgi:hypothetical protein